MKKIKSIYFIFLFFWVMILTSFFILYRYSAESLKSSLKSIARIQMEHAGVLLEQKIKEIEIEADGILNSGDLKDLQLVLDGKYDSYKFVMSVIGMKEYLGSRQKSTEGMAEFILHWPKSGRIVTTINISAVDKDMLLLEEDNRWFIWKNEVYFSRLYKTDWDRWDDEPYLLIRMDRDYLYKIKNMAFGMGSGGTLLLQPDAKSLFPVTEAERAMLAELAKQDGGDMKELELEALGERYQIVQARALKNGLKTVSYYPVVEMMSPVGKITRVTGVLFLGMIAVGLIFMVLYYSNILLQLKIITENLKRMEGGDLTAKIAELPDNEFSYVFEQFNRMTARIRQLIESMMTEQQLRNQAELRQLQLQINPHFLYNSLSYIVTVADRPAAVIEMAVHLSRYYRYCTENKSVTTIGEEVSYARAYLSIMAMRKNLEYTINVSDELANTPIIPLILQPVIENAIEHAIEERENAKHIFVKACHVAGGGIRFEISDDGDGMTDAEIQKLVERIGKKEREEGSSVGLWNVNQRLVNYYDESAGLEFGKSVWGGLLVSFTIKADEKAGEVLPDTESGAQ